MSSDTHSLKGRKLYVPPMAFGSASAITAVFRSVGIDTDLPPESNEQTLELAGRHLSGDECHPEKVTLGDLLRITEQKGFDPKNTAFFMPTAGGPCRFGQYSNLLRTILDGLGYHDIMILSPTSRDGYSEMGTENIERAFWRALVSADMLRKKMLLTRPFETRAGDSDEVYEDSIKLLCDVLEKRNLSPGKRLGRLTETLTRIRDRFRAVPARYDKERPLIGVVGEIFCRLNRFANEDVVRKVEEQGGVIWLSDISEWVWYTNSEKKIRIRTAGKNVTARIAKAKLTEFIQRTDEHALYKPFQEDFTGFEEPKEIETVLRLAQPYLPQSGALGEMVLSAGKACYLHSTGADGVIDISPFSCMNGIVSEAIYPAISEDHDGIPIRNFYFDGTHSDLEQHIGIFLELARGYQKRKKTVRDYPPFF